jgi:hypothetical protein
MSDTTGKRKVSSQARVRDRKERKARQIAEGVTCAGNNWCVEDILSRFDVTEMEAARFMVDIERQLIEAMTIAGWDVILSEAGRRGLTAKPEEDSECHQDDGLTQWLHANQ